MLKYMRVYDVDAMFAGVQQLTYEYPHMPKCLANVIKSSKVRQTKYDKMKIYAVFLPLS